MLSIHKATYKEENWETKNDLVILNNDQAGLKVEIIFLFHQKMHCKAIRNPWKSILKTVSSIVLCSVIFVSLTANQTVLFV